MKLLVFHAFALAIIVAVIVPGGPRDEPAPNDAPFDLVEAKTQRPFGHRSLLGMPAALFFGFTHCPDVCPTALSRATRWLQALGADRDRLRFVFITVDPERDTAERLAQYLTVFDPGIVGLTGTRTETERAIARYKVFAKKQPTGSGDAYMYDHTALIQLYDARGAFRGTLDFDDPEKEALAKLRALVNAPNGGAK